MYHIESNKTSIYLLDFFTQRGFIITAIPFCCSQDFGQRIFLKFLFFGPEICLGFVGRPGEGFFLFSFFFFWGGGGGGGGGGGVRFFPKI